MNNLIWFVEIAVATVILVYLIKILWPILLIPATLLAYPGSLISPSRRAFEETPAKFIFGVLLAAVPYYLFSTVLIATCVGITYQFLSGTTNPHGIVWLVVPGMVSLPMYFASDYYYVARERESIGYKKGEMKPNEAKQIAAFSSWLLSYPTFIVIALMPNLTHSLYGWLPWTQYIHQ